MEPLERETVMNRELKIGMHVVFIDEYRRDRDALITAIHGDPMGGFVVEVRKGAKDLTDEEKASGDWHFDHHDPPIYAYLHDEDGNQVTEYSEAGKYWPCINLVVVSDNESAQDQYGRQLADRSSSVVHQSNSTAVGNCYRFADEKTNRAGIQSTIS